MLSEFEDAANHPEIVLSEFISSLTVKLGPKIVDTGFKPIIESVFESRARDYYMNRLSVYVLLDIMMILLIQKPSYGSVVVPMMDVIMLINLVWYELPQFSSDGFVKYFSNMDNHVDTWMFVLQTTLWTLNWYV